MKAFPISCIFFILVASCKSKDMSLEDLQKAKWDSLAVGLAIISTADDKGTAPGTDSIEFKLKGTSAGDQDLPNVSPTKINGAFNRLLGDVLKPKLNNSQSGYLRINLREIMMNSLTLQVYLRGNTEDTRYYQFKEDSVALMNMQGITNVKYISKEEAMKIIAGDGNEIWESVLDNNPLPSSIEVALEPKEWTKEEMEDLKNLILDKIPAASDVSYPSIMFKSPVVYYFLQYKRMKK